MPPGSGRPGAALVMALLAIIVLEFIVLGTLHLALQEGRIGANRALGLQLRLDAESGVRRALGMWSPDLETLDPGRYLSIDSLPADMPRTLIRVERIGDRSFIIESVATEPSPRVGRVAARLLVQPPAIPPDVNAAPAALSSAGAVRLRSTATVSVDPAWSCSLTPAVYALLAPSPGILIDPGAAMDAPAGDPEARPLSSFLDRLLTLAPQDVRADTDTIISADFEGALIARGDVTIAAGTTFRGLLVADGTVTIETSAAVLGAVHAGASALVAGEIRFEPCLVADAIRAGGLDRPRPFGARPWLPGF
jgi:hypothetical protein